MVLYLHHPLKHMGQREEGDEHIFSAGPQWDLGDRSCAWRGMTVYIRIQNNGTQGILVL